MKKPARPYISNTQLVGIFVVTGAAMLSDVWFKAIVAFMLTTILTVLGLMWKVGELHDS